MRIAKATYPPPPHDGAGALIGECPQRSATDAQPPAGPASTAAAPEIVEALPVSLTGGALVCVGGKPALVNQEGRLYVLVLSMEIATPNRLASLVGAMAAAAGAGGDGLVVTVKRVNNGHELVASLAKQGVGVMFNPSLCGGGRMRWLDVKLVPAPVGQLQ